MSNYCSIANIKDVINQAKLLTISDTDGDITETAVSTVIEDIMAEINIRLCYIYVVPLSDPIPVVVRNLCAKWCAGIIINRIFGAQNTETSNYAQYLINDAKKDLRRLIIAIKNDLISYSGQTKQTKEVDISDLADQHLMAIIEEDVQTET